MVDSDTISKQMPILYKVNDEYFLESLSLPRKKNNRIIEKEKKKTEVKNTYIMQWISSNINFFIN